MNLFPSHGCTSNLAFLNLGNRSCFNIKSDSITRAALVSGEGNLLSYTNGRSTLTSDKAIGIEIQPDAIAFGTLTADSIATSTGFPVDNEFDLDSPTEGFSSIPEAIEDIRQGKVGQFV